MALQRGRYPHVKIGGSVRFREKAVMEWLLQRGRERKRKNFETWEKYLT
jgi:predicted DNA-binding transcriptional regulator AlpA